MKSFPTILCCLILAMLCVVLASPACAQEEISDTLEESEEVPRYPRSISGSSSMSLSLWIGLGEESPLPERFAFGGTGRSPYEYGVLSVLRTSLGIRYTLQHNRWSLELRTGAEFIALRQTHTDADTLLLHATRSFGAAGRLGVSRRIHFLRNDGKVNDWGIDVSGLGMYSNTFVGDTPESEVLDFLDDDAASSSTIRYGAGLMLSRKSHAAALINAPDEYPKRSFEIGFGARFWGQLFEIDIEGERAGENQSLYHFEERTAFGIGFPLRFETITKSGDRTSFTAGSEIVFAPSLFEFHIWMGLVF